MKLQCDNSRPPTVHLVGRIEHPDLRDTLELLQDGAQQAQTPGVFPELVVVALSRPGEIEQAEIQLLQLRWPLAGIVAILGSWCEGDTRTGRPWPGVKRLYWYEFPAWWRRQLALRAAGLCPEWARPTNDVLPASPIRNPQSAIRNPQRGVIVLSAANRDTAIALADVLRHAGYATVWQSPGRPTAIVRGALAGIWDGGQLDDREANDLAAFRRALEPDHAPVIALLDFPRRDRYDVAKRLGVAAVLGKPWLNLDLIATIADVANHDTVAQLTACSRAA